MRRNYTVTAGSDYQRVVASEEPNLIMRSDEILIKEPV